MAASNRGHTGRIADHGRGRRKPHAEIVTVPQADTAEFRSGNHAPMAIMLSAVCGGRGRTL